VTRAIFPSRLVCLSVCINLSLYIFTSQDSAKISKKMLSLMELKRLTKQQVFTEQRHSQKQELILVQVWLKKYIYRCTQRRG
jgi:hypothetical protein